MLRLLRTQTANAAADKAADLIAVKIVQIHAAILQRLPGGVDSQLRETVGTAHFFSVWKGRSGIEVLDLRSDLARELADIK